MSYVFLTDGQQRKTLAAARSLGRKGVNIMIGENTRWATSLFSRYCCRQVIYPDPHHDKDRFYNFLKENLLAKYPIETFWPMDDAVMDIVIPNSEELSNYCLFLLPETESYYIASDKALAVNFAEELGVNCPKSFVPSRQREWINNDCADIDGLSSGLAYPLVIKPRKSSGSRGISFVTRKEEFQTIYERINKQYPQPLIQEFIPPGVKHDVCLLYDRGGRLKASFVQKEIRHFPQERGPSTVQESVWRPDLVAKADMLMKGLNWRGIAEVEFMNDPRDGKDKFMEINSRFWGSLYLSILAGVDFPWLYYCLIKNDNCEEIHSYQLGIKCRWLLPGDLLYVLAKKNFRGLDPPFLAGKKSGVYDDILSKSDPLPSLGFLLAVFRYLPDRKMWRFMLDR